MIILITVFTVYFGFLVNIPFYVKWVKKKSTPNEVFLYTVKGKYSYLSVIDQLERIENAIDLKLPKLHRTLTLWKRNCDKRNVPFSAYKKKAHRLLKEEAFGHPMVINAFKRMPTYTKITAIWDVFILIWLILSWTMLYCWQEITIENIALGIITGFPFAAPFWLFAHKILNGVLKKGAEKQLRKNKSAKYFQVVMAHFWGFMGGVFWKDLMWENHPSSYRPSLYGAGAIGWGYGQSGGYSDFGGFGGGSFGGGGAGGDW